MYVCHKPEISPKATLNLRHFQFLGNKKGTFDEESTFFLVL